MQRAAELANEKGTGVSTAANEAAWMPSACSLCECNREIEEQSRGGS
jgi:hypothetical protein